MSAFLSAHKEEYIQNISGLFFSERTNKWSANAETHKHLLNILLPNIFNSGIKNRPFIATFSLFSK